MEYRNLGATDLRISTVSFGCWAMGGVWWGKVDDDESIAAVRGALDLGVNFFDTADVYGFGHSEEILAKALGSRRNQVYVATKGGLEWDDKNNITPNNSRAHILSAAEASLRRLKTDAIDLYQIHWPDPKVPIAETATACLELLNSGKVRAVGVSNFSASQMAEWREVAPLHSLQPPYSLLDRAVEAEILPYCLENNIGVIVYSPLQRGILTGKFTADSKFGSDDLRSGDKGYQGEDFERNLAIVEELKRLAAKASKTVGQLAIAWVLSNPAVTSAIVGAKRPSQVEENVGGAGWALTEAQKAEIEQIIARGGQPGD